MPKAPSLSSRGFFIFGRTNDGLARPPGKAWANEGRYRDTHRALTFTKRGLEIGNGTVVVKYTRDDWNRRILCIDGQEELILVLLSVAWDQPMPDGIIEHFHSASRAFSKGELSLAHIHLAYTGLQPLEADEETLRLLFMAEGFLRAGVPGNEIRKAWGLGKSTAFPQPRWTTSRRLRKENKNHYPGGMGQQSGEFAPKDGTSGQYGENVDQEYIRQKVVSALQGKQAIALVGGAMDESTNGAIFGMLKQFQDDHPGVEIKYFTNDGKLYDPEAPATVPQFGGGRGNSATPPAETLDSWLGKQAAIYGSDNVAVIGHSMGADAAARTVENGQKVGALITLDGVSLFSSRNFTDVKSNASTWINVNANPTEEKKKAPGLHGNFWADSGTKWNNDPDGVADHHYNANINHADVKQFLR